MYDISISKGVFFVPNGYGMRNLFWSYTPAKCYKCYEKGKKWISAHVCLDMLCFCILKRIGIATLFSQLWILNNFEKKIIKKGWKILDFRENFEILKNLKISKIFLQNFHWKSYWKSKILKILKISIFQFSLWFSIWFFRFFRIFGENFSTSDFFRKSRNFQQILMIFFAKSFKIQS